MQKLQNVRDEYLRKLDHENVKFENIGPFAKDLFSLGLTVYSKSSNFESLIYNSFAKSSIDDNVSLHPSQIELLEKISENSALIVSAPTSFGKTFVVFEYIARIQPQNVVLVVPTLALMDEYRRKIISKYSSSFSDYSIYFNLTEDQNVDQSHKNIFLITHDRAIDEKSYQLFNKIDLLVIDEVYKLQRNDSDDRVLVLNLAYYYLAKIAERYILLAPFIGGIKDITKLEKVPVFYRSSFSPVVNDIVVHQIERDDEALRFQKVTEILESSGMHKTMIYFPTVVMLSKFVRSIGTYRENIVEEKLKRISDWVKEEIHPEWYVVKSMDKGFLVHNGQVSPGIRNYHLSLYDDKNSGLNFLLCTSTLLEGVNTTAKQIIICKAARSHNEQNFDDFDFFNLVGRTGRLNEHYLGLAHYIKTPDEPIYSKKEALKEIAFELTEGTDDIDRITKDIENKAYADLKLKVGFVDEEYMSRIGNKYRSSTILQLYNNYLRLKGGLLLSISNYLEDNKIGRPKIVSAIYDIITDHYEKKWSLYLDKNVIVKLLDLRRPKTRVVIDSIFNSQKFKKKPTSIDDIVGAYFRIKNGFLEHEYYSKLLIIHFFMEKDGVELEYLNVLDKQVKHNIEILYFTNAKTKKILKDIGIYEHDIAKISNVIGDDLTNYRDVKFALITNRPRFRGLSIITEFVLDSMQK